MELEWDPGGAPIRFRQHARDVQLRAERGAAGVDGDFAIGEVNSRAEPGTEFTLEALDGFSFAQAIDGNACHGDLAVELFC